MESSHSPFSNRQPDRVEPKRPSTQLRNNQRQQQIQGMKKAVRYNWNVQQTIQYLQRVQHTNVESQEIILQAIQNQNVQHLVELIVTADSLFKTAVIDQAHKLFNLIQAGLSTRPSAILLLGNLCALYQQFIKQSINRGLLQKLTDMLSNLKSCPKSLQIPSWAVTKLCRQPCLLPVEVVECSVSSLCPLMAYILPLNKQQYRLIQTHLYRILSQLATVILFNQPFLQFIATLRPNREVDLINYFMVLYAQANSLTYSQNTTLRIAFVNGLLWVYPQIKHSLPKSKNYVLHNIIRTIVQKSEPQLCIQIMDSHLSPVIVPYQYSSNAYLCLLYTMLQKLPSLPQKILQILREKQTLQNLMHDITDPNMEIAYRSLKCVKLVVEYVLSQGNVQYIDWLLGLGLEEQVISFIDYQGGRDNAKIGQQLLDMIKTG